MTGLLEDDHKGGDSLKVATETVNRTIAKILTYKGFDKWCDHSRKHAQTVIYNEHHFLHACCGFYNSGFDDAAIIVVDAMGNALKNNDRDVEVATTFIGGYPNTMVPIVGMSTPTYMAVILQNIKRMELWNRYGIFCSIILPWIWWTWGWKSNGSCSVW